MSDKENGKRGVSFTEEQQKVIDTHGCSLLVSAAAGSGKTAVLVERIVKMISEGDCPADIDRLLVVTFTNAAAAEMRERISSAIGAKLVKEPANEHLQRQATLIHNAQITTIDSFCLFLIRNHFHVIGLDPGFRIADEGESKLLRHDVLEEVLEQHYQEAKPAFLDCMEYFSTGSRDRAVEDAVLKLYDFAMSHPFPDQWLLERKKDYDIPPVWQQGAATAEPEQSLADGAEPEQSSADGAEPEQSLADGAEPEQSLADGAEPEQSSADSLEPAQSAAWLDRLLWDTGLLLQGAIDQISRCIELAEEPDGPYMYGELLEREKEMLEKLLAAKTYMARCLAFEELSFGRLSSKRDACVSSGKRELVKSIRGEVKEQLQSMQKRFFLQSEEENVRQMRACGEAVSGLVDLTISFREAFDAAKREKNLLDFDDMEHFALSILLRREDDGTVSPTETALEYRNHFTEILIDEYQDSNLVQEYLLSAVSREAQGSFNRFMVGDVKQSIYKFRLARPEIFMEKYHAYENAGKGNALRIDLHRNFRSREQVLTAVNAVFSKVMSRQLGGIEYDRKAALYPGASYPAGEDPQAYDAELLLFTEGEKEREISTKQLEAYGIAKKIRRLVTSFQVTDKESGQLRKASYKDIVILLRTTSGWDEEFKQVLEGEGIPVHVTSKTGYFASEEIRTLLHVLRILDNPLQDIPLYGVLRSCFGGFSEEEVAAVKTAFPKKRYLYDALREYAYAEATGEEIPNGKMTDTDAESAGIGSENGSDKPERDCVLKAKLRAFLERLAGCRDRSAYLSVHELLQELIRDYDYLSYVSVRPGGSRRRANVEMLLVKAADYEKTSYYGLYHFLRYIEQLEKYDVDYGEANLQDENADVVRIMSIHKSKGLEFPICFVAGLSKSFNQQDANARLVLDVEEGIGVDYVDSVARVSSRSLRRNYISSRIKQENLAEELRVLYVAMTRAREKLILTGTMKEPEKKNTLLMLLHGRRQPEIPYDILLRMGSFLDVLLLASARNCCFDPLWEACGMGPDTDNPLYREEICLQISLETCETLARADAEESLVRTNQKRKLLLGASDGIDRIDQNLLTLMSEKFAYRYPYENLRDLYTKTTVSELKKAGMQEEMEESNPLFKEEPVIPYVPKFIRQEAEQTVSGTDRGSAFHKVMELFDFKKLTELDNTEEAAGKEETKGTEAGEGTAAEDGTARRRERLRMLLLAEMKQMLADGKMSQLYYDTVSVSKLVTFLESPLAARMAKAAAAGKLYKEQPFVLGLPADRLKESFPAAETVLIQGIIDVFFEEDGGYVVLDYKTDAVKKPEELTERYHTQLAYYAEALEQLSGYRKTGRGMRVVQKIIYSFGLGKEIVI